MSPGFLKKIIYKLYVYKYYIYIYIGFDIK